MLYPFKSDTSIRENNLLLFLLNIFLGHSPLPKTRTNFGIFNIRYQGPKIWNSLDVSDKKLLGFQLKKKLKIHFIDSN